MIYTYLINKICNNLPIIILFYHVNCILGSCDLPGWKLRDRHKKVQARSKGLLNVYTREPTSRKEGLGDSLREVGSGFLKELGGVKAMCKHAKVQFFGACAVRLYASCVASPLAR